MFVHFTTLCMKELIEDNKLVKTDLGNAEILNKLFSNIVQDLDISGYSNNEP